MGMTKSEEQIIRDSMVALVCDQPLLTERFYTKHFGFHRARVYMPGPYQVVVLKAGNTYLQIFPAFEMRPPCLDAPSNVVSPYAGGIQAGPLYSGVRKLAFLVEDVEKILADMGAEAKVVQSERPGLIPGSKSVWIADPSNNVVELIEGYSDDAEPPALPEIIRQQPPLWRKWQDVNQAVAAAGAGDSRALAEWLESGGNPNQYDRDGWTPLLAAAVRGRAEAVQVLLGSPLQVDLDMPFLQSDALAIHFAGQSGDVRTASLLLDTRPDHLERIWTINGHTLLLQAVFFGHLELAAFALKRGANAAATTLRGLAPMELARQFQNQPMMDLIRPHDLPREEKTAYYQILKQRIASYTPPGEREEQQRSDRLVAKIEEGLQSVLAGTATTETVLEQVKGQVEEGHPDVNRLGGVLRQPPLVVAVTGNDGDPPVPAAAALRKELASYLLGKGANPTVREQHPMGVHAIIRAAVFNHLDILKMMGERLSAAQLADALNERPSVNGLTALHDTVLRASTCGPERLDGYLAQIRWFVGNGARSDIEDFSGRTQRELAEGVEDPERRQTLLRALAAR